MTSQQKSKWSSRVMSQLVKLFGHSVLGAAVGAAGLGQSRGCAGRVRPQRRVLPGPQSITRQNERFKKGMSKNKNRKKNKPQVPPPLYFGRKVCRIHGREGCTAAFPNWRDVKPAQLEIRGRAPSHAGGQNLRIPHADASTRMPVQFLQNYSTGHSSEERARANRGASNE